MNSLDTFQNYKLSKIKFKQIIGGNSPSSNNNYIDGILLPPYIDPNDIEAVMRYLAWLGSGPGGGDIFPG